MDCWWSFTWEFSTGERDMTAVVEGVKREGEMGERCVGVMVVVVMLRVLV